MNSIPVNDDEVESGWKKFDDPRPYVTVSGFALFHGKAPLLYRSNNVRSAKNCWSVPSGLHEVGRTMGEQFARELFEELGLVWANAPRCDFIHAYENISSADRWHWVINILSLHVRGFDSLVNREPDKHSEIRLVTFDELHNLLFDPKVNWAPNLANALIESLPILRIYFRESARLGKNV
jgi:ADP-ribose pyrophosphatase YjhB (NUDIX family)